MLFFDTSFILGLFNENDDNHHKVKKILEMNPDISKQKKAINNIVLTEVLNKIKKDYYRNVRVNIINFLLSMDEIYHVEDEDYLKAIELMQYYKYTVNYSDCLIILSMFNNNIDTIVSFDSDFNRIDGINRIYI